MKKIFVLLAAVVAFSAFAAEPTVKTADVPKADTPKVDPKTDLILPKKKEDAKKADTKSAEVKKDTKAEPAKK